MSELEGDYNFYGNWLLKKCVFIRAKGFKNPRPDCGGCTANWNLGQSLLNGARIVRYIYNPESRDIEGVDIS